MNNMKVWLSAILLAGIWLAVNIQPKPHMVMQNSEIAHSPQPTVPKQSVTPLNTTEKMIWNGKSGNLFIKWTTVDLYWGLASHNEKIFSPLVKKSVEDFVANQEDSPSCQYERYFTLLSVVGTLVSFADSSSYYCGGTHPTLDRRFTTIDLSKAGEVSYADGEESSGLDIDMAKLGKVVKLTDYFSEEDILSALLADRVVKKALANLPHPAHPKTLSEIPQIFADNYYELGNSGFELRPDFLTRFVFHHIEGNKVAVRIGLPPHHGANHAQHLQLGLLLPIPTTLKQVLILAETGKEGFLMKDAQKIGGDETSSFKFKIK